MPSENQITSSCKIDRGKVYKDGIVIFENKSGGIAQLLLSAYQHFGLNYPKFYKMDKLCKLGWLASEVLLKGGYAKNGYQPQETGLVLAGCNSSLDNDINYFESAKAIASPSLFVYTLPNIVIGEICIRNHFKGEHAFFIQDAFDAGFAVRQVDYLLDNKLLKACICGWVDALGEDYKAVLFLVEKRQDRAAAAFSAENINHIFETV